MHIYKNRWFAKFARREGIADARLREAIDRANAGLIDADLGGGLVKQRVARDGRDDPAAIGRSSSSVRRNGRYLSLGSPRMTVRISARRNLPSCGKRPS